jgi:ABC-2 type transport system ATP-binding protein
MSENAIEIRGLQKTFSSFALGPLNLTVPSGGIYGLIGPNGAGKTTTIDLIMGIGHKDAGSIKIFDMDHIREEVAVKLRIGYVSPELSFDAWGKISRLITFMRPFYPDWDNAYSETLMRRLSLNPEDRISTLSFGSRTKLGLLMALSHRPPLLLLDEPMSGLDAVARQEVYSELLHAVGDENRSVLISSHDLHDLERFTDHIGIIRNGKMLLEGVTSEIVERYRMVDFVIQDSARLSQIGGVCVRRLGNCHYRVLMNNTHSGMDTLQAINAQEITESPVTLEEIFVELMKEE